MSARDARHSTKTGKNQAVNTDYHGSRKKKKCYDKGHLYPVLQISIRKHG